MWGKTAPAKARRLDRIRGALYGVAIGDCLGTPAEFKTAQEVQQTYGRISEIIGGGFMHLAPGVGTDDTAMTLAVAEGLMNAKPGTDPVEAVGREFVRWYCGEPIGLGATCGRAIYYASQDGRIASPTRDMWLRASKQTHVDLQGRSGGNGTLMRTLPVALLDKNQIMLAYDISKMTHWDDDAAIACMLYCDAVRALIRGAKMLDALDPVLSEEAYRPALSMDRRFIPNPTGYVVDTFNTALWGLTRGAGFEDTLIRVVNLGGDADTTGAITGGLAGAAYGYSGIPGRWLTALDKGLVARLEAVIDRAAKVWGCIK